MDTLLRKIVTRIAVLKNSLKDTEEENLEAVKLTLDFNIEFYESLAGIPFTDDAYKMLPTIKRFQNKRAYKDNGGLYYDLFINDVKYDSYDSIRDVRAVVEAINTVKGQVVDLPEMMEA